MGHHLKLLKELIAQGYDCSVDTFDHSQLPSGTFGLPDAYPDNWPPLHVSQACFGQVLAGDQEPFLLNFLAECSKNACGEWIPCRRE